MADINDIANIQDYAKRMADIMKNDTFSIGIGEIAETTGLTQSQIRYWEQKGFIKSIKTNKNQNRKYSYHTLSIIRLIKSYLDSGFTLKTAAEKANAHKKMGKMLRQIFTDRFVGVEEIDGLPCINLGFFDKEETQTLYVVIHDDSTEIKVVPVK
ncbi:MerR family transcriptional regulator [Dellaglioa algida]|uniref:MerR family transcriptional regulator n=1 Tax=Dellaglioa algida TaxID=105612 RepID=A0A5C6M8B3_9LACO|nr:MULTISPECIES: MerR family transcriptional regulator [Dellaglioa]MCZ2493541.1 MerR family transcriptional regulator [Dellaglioa carnosa]MDK1717515.1 MerR family transcriptional regulator [Dellaglioa algida]MDK1720744.1 MerR family transcriptional regulator [Dellaglioa algida]MDK1722413.1 MerR family transcriptional regulator [Dellaglioa algida]MDK1724081.1 MerR family transcriptional regulator [Dellaglioa algida]